MAPLSGPRGRAFAELVYRVLVIEKRWPIEVVARQLGMKYDTLYSRINGRVVFSPDEIRALLRAAPDHRLIDILLAESPFIAINRSEPDSGNRAPSIHRNATECMLKSADVLRVVEVSLKGDRIDHRDRPAVLDMIDAAERSLAALRHRLADG